MSEDNKVMWSGSGIITYGGSQQFVLAPQDVIADPLIDHSYSRKQSVGNS